MNQVSIATAMLLLEITFELMKEFVEVINSRELIEGDGPIIRALIAHFYLVSIHPFGDGNGRTSRALEAYILYHLKFNARGFYSLSNYCYRNREKYVGELTNAKSSIMPISRLCKGA